GQIADLDTQSQAAGGLVEQLKTNQRSAVVNLERAADRVGAARTLLEQAQQAVAVAGEPLDAEHVSAAERAAVEAEATVADALAERARLEGDIAELESGLPLRPEGLDQFRTALDEVGIGSELVAERIEVPHGVAAEAALNEKVWAL